jgi:two-component system, chemotaxis family, sensor histidine kinase and response regulator PixL
MAINPDIRDQAYQFFIEEAPELLQVIESGLLTLNQDHSTAKIHGLMRAAHSLKGGAASVGLETIATLAHRLENIFKALYNENLATKRDLETWLLQAYDCLRLPLIAQITTGSFDQSQALSAAEPIFNQIESLCGDALLQADSYIPSSTEMGVDLVFSIFEVDVAQGIERIAAMVAQPQSLDLANELQSQMEVFAGFAELLNLPNFGAIAQAVQQALAHHPEYALDIAQLALVELETSKQAVLAGDRVGGPGPSVALIEFAAGTALIDPASTLEMGKIDVSDQLLASEVDVAGDREEPGNYSENEIVNIEDTIKSALPLLENIFGNAFVSSHHDEDLIIATNKAGDNNDVKCEKEDNEFVDLESAATETLEIELLPEIGETENSNLSAEHYTNLSGLEPGLEPNLQAELNLQQILSNNSSNYAAIQPNANWRLTPVQSTRSASALTVRVDSERLERMNNLVGELGINRSSLALQNDQLQRVLRELRSRFARFQTLVSRLQGVSNQMLVAPERSRWTGIAEERFTSNSRLFASNQSVAADAAAIEFDALEMDRYGVGYAELQAILEDLVQLEESVDDIALFARQSHQTLDQQQTMLTQLRDELVWARMLPLSEILNRFPRVLRDLSVTYQKPVNLKLTGAEVLIDRAILEKLYDPLLHLLRNAFDHGIESVDLRQQQGKSEQGQIEIRAFHKGNQTVIEVQDDGQGLNLNRIRQRVLELKWLSAEQLAVMSPAQLYELIFEPGFSTATQVSELSGRGFGLDVVRSQLQAIRGKVTVSSVPGEGTTFTLSLPLTLTITQLIICLAGSLPLALPADGVADVLSPQDNQIEQSDSESYLYWREQWIPIYSLSRLLHYTCLLPTTSASRVISAFPAPKDWASPMIVLRQGQQVFALAVDRILTEQELMIKPFGSAIAPPSYVYGCTILGDGSPIPVIDTATLLALQSSESNRSDTLSDDLVTANQAYHHSPPVVIQPAQAPTILVVDDAVTLRRTLALFLEREGFRVLQAQDGQEAIEQLQQNPLVQLILCDIEMPAMNGFEFLSYRRQDIHIAKIPTVILTSRSNEKHRWLAMQLGATAYFTKPYLEQELLLTLKNLLQPS